MFAGMGPVVPTVAGALVSYLLLRYSRRLLAPLLRLVRRG